MRKLLIVIALVVFLTPVPGLSALNWSINLLDNPGAENGNLASWVPGPRAVASQSQNEHTGVVYPHSGNWFFNMCGARAGSMGTIVVDGLYQDVDVAANAADIDAGLLVVNANAWLQTEDSPDHAAADYGQLSVYFLNESGSQIDTLSTGLTQSPNQEWVTMTIGGPAPGGTRTLRFELLGEKREGGWMNAFFDDANLQVAVIPEPATICLLGAGVFALLKKRR